MNIKRALVSVSDKTGIVEFCRALQDLGVEILSTGGTARALAQAGIEHVEVSDYTGFPEMMDGRVKTLHPKTHGGILAIRGNPEHMRQAEAHGVRLIDLVVCNLYPFQKTVSVEGVSREEAVEMVDIGGPAMIRAAAKNHAHVAVLTDPAQYSESLEEMRQEGGISEAARRRYALAAFQLTANYDAAIAAYLGGEEPFLAQNISAQMERIQELRYGENPHQKAAFYRVKGQDSPWAQMKQLAGPELSYNNILDADAAWGAVRDFERPTCAVVKHTNPCGLASRDDMREAFRAAFAADPISAFGGIAAFNRTVDEPLAKTIRAAKHPTSGQRLLLHLLIAPEVEPSAAALLSRSKSLRILTLPLLEEAQVRYRSVEGAMLVQEGDGLNQTEADWKSAAQRVPTETEWADLRFAWKCAKHVKSNAIVVAKGETLLGMGAGQPNRVHSARIALAQAGLQAEGAVMASDALMPFLDTAAIGAAHGIRAFIQPGGSVRDKDSVAVADAVGAAMVFTGARHFRH